MDNKILKKYSKNYSKIRRSWINLFRPIKKVSFLQPIVIIMFSLFSLSAGLFGLGFNHSEIPFLSGFLFVLLSLIYFKFYPLTWDEMTDDEKMAFREFWKYPSNWEPKNKNNQ